MNWLTRWYPKLIATTLTAATLAPTGCAASAEELSGRYTVLAPDGFWTLLLEVDSHGSVFGLLGDPGQRVHTLNGTYDGEDLIGEVVSLQRPGEFEIYFDEELGQLRFSFTPTGADGAPQSENEMDWPMVAGHQEEALSIASDPQAEGSKEVSPPSRELPGAARPESRDPRLIGLWRTEVIVSDPLASFVQDLFLEFRGDGIMVQRTGGTAFSNADGSISATGGEVEVAEWRTVGDELHVRLATTPWVRLARVYIEGPSLLLTYFDGDRKVWVKM